VFKAFLITSVVVQSVAVLVIAWFLYVTTVEVKLIPDKIDMLLAADTPTINIPECPKCPDCPQCPDNQKELAEVKKLIKTALYKLNHSVQYYYGCQ
jgi:hypothetical protein